MEKIQEKNGHGLAYFSLVILGLGFVITFFIGNCVLGAIVAVLSVVFSSAGLIESRRSGAHTARVIVILILTIAGALIAVGITGAFHSFTPLKNNGTLLYHEKQLKELEEKAAEEELKLKQLEMKLDSLEKDTITLPVN